MFNLMSKKAKTHIPRGVVVRLTRYYAILQELRSRRAQWVSSSDIAEWLGLTSSTVRQDLSHIDFRGISRKGYNVEGLAATLAKTLGADTTWSMVVVGAGNLGHALALHEEFPRKGFHIKGVFDSDPAKIGRRIGSLRVMDVLTLPRFIYEKKIDIGLIAVPSQAAQQVADLLVAGRIRGILNLTQTHIVTPKTVPVAATRIVSSLQELAHLIKRQS